MVVIAISGQPGSGKTTVAREVARVLNLPLVSSGSLFRELAAKMGIDFIEFHKYAEKNPDIDKVVDSMAIERAKAGNVVLEGHLAAWIVRPYADICIYLKASSEIRARRISIRDKKSFEDALREVREREELNRRRYLSLYNIDINDLSVFDLVLDTSYLSINDAIRISLDYICTVLGFKYSRKFC
ncbi:cytidylate kinase, putative [Pyrobaculum islandicum DSM 4184]|uniref:Cytidylate kinase n=1 Tax=Pyrobaculum islandicum (strain DSM 4184 / JCM 9189 / GEO3) TaxID=384616 RepID=KCY_PYRIL|nr:AAA family ATPase [Pyrobaculum islandicum]A1RRJ5.1 RecName: Full=Cytidylate kinase; Short=CK; AltName: Full=Cytidine monophosphate kinase; Short=CMP kinase [Pyrobaculum islandicum DSM 4184]ABL87577.1 cytidylate kinase, putative [Pyrobaculum islandicum DSM 4184]